MSSAPTHYYGGEASSIGSVHRLPVHSWAQFVKETLGHPSILNVTRQQFHAMDKKQRNAAKRVRYVCPATFRDSKRITANAVDISLLALDIDDSTHALPFVRTPSLLRERLAPYAFAAYTTASSTEAAPKLRILLPADHIPVRHYAACVKTIASVLGLPKLTTESMVPVQPMYLPTLFRGDSVVDDHPLISAVIDGQPVTLADVKDVKFPDSDLPSPDNTDDLHHLRTTVDDVSKEDAIAALSHLDPDCSMQEWITVGCALRHQWGEEAFALWRDWSARGKKFDGDTAIRDKWKYIRATPPGRAPVTIRTLFHRAQEAGWKGYASVARKSYEKTLQWLQDPTRTEHELLAEGTKRVASTRMVTSIDRSALMSHLMSAFRRLGVKPSAVALRKEIQRLERASDTTGPAKTARPQDEAELPRWARGICFVSGQDEFFQRATDTRLNPEVLDRVHGRHLMSSDDDGSGRPFVRPRDYLLNIVKIPTVANYLYDPSGPEDTFVEHEGVRYVNTYLPSYPESDKATAREAEDVLHGHLTKLIGEPEYRAIALDFLAYIVQHPGQKIRWAFLLQGAMGCGKTAVAEAMKAVLGPTNANVLDASLLFTPFNGWATGSQLVSMEEIRVVGHNRHEVMNRLKPCISNDTVVINRKNRDLQYVPNRTNYLMFTNHHDSLAVSEEDRRYFVVNSALQTKADVRALGPQYFPRLFKVIENKAGGLRYWLENHKISAKFDPSGHAPQTKYLRDLAGAAATPLTAAIKQVLEDRSVPLVQPDLISTRALKVAISDENLPRFSDQQLAVALRELNYVLNSRVRLDDDGGRHSLWTRRDRPVKNADEVAAARLSGKQDTSIL